MFPIARLRYHLIALASLAAMFALPGLGQTMNTQNGEWPTYGGNLANWRYSPLDQINADNFDKLEVAWRFNTAALGPRPEFKFESTPLMVRGVVYTTAGTRRAAVALDAATGEMLWMHSENEGERGKAAPRQLSGRGLAYWSDGNEERILYVTPGYRLIALNAKTGAPVTSFGVNGVVDLKLDDDQQMDVKTGEVGLHATPIVTGNTVIIGAAHLNGGAPPSRTHVKGFVRGYDVKTGKRLWIFHTIPMAGEFGLDTWKNDSWSYTGNAGVWAQISVDEQLGLVYLPVELPTGDYYGGHRPGAGLFGESIVAVDVHTGKRKWHYQLVHHGIFDMDIPCAPMLVDLNINGQTVKAVAQPTKQSYLYVFNRETGAPIWPITEQPVAKGDVPGEWYSPTQPIPSKPPAYDRQGVTEDDLIDFTPELHAAAIESVKKYRIGSLFTAPVVSQPQGPRATIHMPGSNGGADWPGGSWDPETDRLYVYSQTSPTALGLVKPDPKVSDMNYIQGIATPPGGGGGGGLEIQGLPLIKPPWGRITAFDLDKGEILWQVAHGGTPDYVKNNPALKGLNIPRTGRPGIIGVLTTKTLVIAGESSFVTTPKGRGAMLRAYDKATGKEVGAVYLPAPQSGSPMTYLLNGQQYLVLAISGPGFPGELIAFRLPSSN
jgi:quinoprotein glucose dehydrogenase